MTNDILERILTDVIRIYLGYDDYQISAILENQDLAIKERIAKIEHLEVLIYSNDHLPPHFHVKSNDLKIDAKFSIATGEYMQGEIGSRDIKKINAFYNSPKGKIILDLIWKKFHG